MDTTETVIKTLMRSHKTNSLFFTTISNHYKTTGWYLHFCHYLDAHLCRDIKSPKCNMWLLKPAVNRYPSLLSFIKYTLKSHSGNFLFDSKSRH